MPDATGPSPISTAELLAIGAELLVGDTRDTNSSDVARSLTELGVEVRRISQLPDEREVIADAVLAALARTDLVVTSGGLGPTPDDLTREGIARALGEEPSVDPDLEAWLRDLWARRGLDFSTVNLKQAWLIPSAVAMDNPHGTAPGWWVERDGAVIIALPGPPRELLPMWRDQALPRLQARGLGVDRASQTLHLIGIGESMLVDLIGPDALKAINPSIATYARADWVDIRVSAIGDGTHTAEHFVDAAVAGLRPRIDPYLFGRDDDDWTVAIGARMGRRRLATAEIGTGGYLGLLLGQAAFLHHAEQVRDVAADLAVLAADLRRRAGVEVSLAAMAHESGVDMSVEVAVDIEGRRTRNRTSVFRGGDIGRRRAANAAAAELWRRLAS